PKVVYIAHRLDPSAELRAPGRERSDPVARPAAPPAHPASYRVCSPELMVRVQQFRTGGDGLRVLKRKHDTEAPFRLGRVNVRHGADVPQALIVAKDAEPS